MPYKNKKYTKKAKKPYLLYGLALVLVLSGALFLVFSVSSNNEESPGGSDFVDGINLGPPTEEEQAAGDRQKEQIIAQDDLDSEDGQNSQTTTEVVLVDASQYDNEIEVRAFVTSLVMDGSCVIRFTKGDLEVTRTVAAFADATTTPCVTLTVPRSEFSEAGVWNVQITFNSASANGSTESTIEIL